MPISLENIRVSEDRLDKLEFGKGFDKFTFLQNETILLHISNSRHTVSCIELVALSSFNTYSR